MTKQIWLRIVIVAIIVGLIAGGLTALLPQFTGNAPKLYTADLMLMVPPPNRDKWNFTAGLQTNPDSRNDIRYQVAMLAQSKGVLNKVIAAMGDRLPKEQRTPLTLRQWIQVISSQAVFVKLTAKANTPALTTNLLQTWAAIVCQEANDLYYYPNSDLPSIQKAAQQAYQQLQEKDRTLQNYKAKTGLGLVSEGRLAVEINEREGIKSGYGGFVAPSIQLGVVNQQLADQRHAQTILSALQQRIATARKSGATLQQLPLAMIDTLAIPAEDHFSSNELSALPDLDALQQAIATEQKRIDQRIALLEPEANALQKQLADETFTLKQLIREKDVAENSYVILQRKISEIQAEKIAQLRTVHVDSGPDTPEPASPQRSSKSLALAAFLVGFFIALLGQWAWREHVLP